ncbi:hypothetical protein MTP99_007040 [Tenebrio molitor]|nr:hypothetical protein MTP99_007040 [Tenebrio molitor]
MADTSLDQIFYSNHADKKREQILLQSIVHTAKMPDKNIWASLMQALNYWFKIPNEKFEAINNIIKLWRVTNYVLIDVEENALIRDGAATANSLYGNSHAINSAYYGLFIILEKVHDLGKYDAVKLATENFLDFHKGKGMEFNWRDFLKCPTEEEYVKMAIRKTGSIVLLTIQLMQLFSETKSDFSAFAKILGKFFRTYDDYANLYSIDEHLINKNGCDNLTEGKFSFPIVHAVQNHLKDHQLMNILRRKVRNPEHFKYCRKLLEQVGSIEYTKQTLRNLRSEAEEEMKKFEENPCMIQLLDDIFSKLKMEIS